MHSSIMGISSVYGREEEISLQDRLQFIFILRKELITNEDIRMITMMYYSKHELKRYGYSAKDYFMIKDKIQEAAKKQRRILRIVLVTDALNCQDILLNSSQGNNRALQNVERIFVFSKNKDHKHYNFEAYENVVVKCIPIRSYINGAIKILKDCKQSPHLFRSMIFLGNKRQERLSYLVKVWVKAWLSIKPSQYQENLQKYLKYLLQLYQKQNDSPYGFQYSQISQIRQILSLMEKKANKQYSKKALMLYQQQIIFFYRSLNMGIKKLIEDINYSEGIAIPFKMIFQSIKNQFHDLISKRQYKNRFGQKFTKNGIERIFKDEDYIVLWRWAKIGGQQIRKMSQNGNYIEFMNFTSTSRSKKVACTFFSQKDIEGDCLIKIILKKPQFKQQLQKFPFIYLSFAYLQDISSNNQYQILFNALTVAKVLKLSKITYSSLEIKHESLKKNQQLFLIELQIGQFYELLTEYSNNPNNQIFTQSQRAIFQNYLITLEALNEKQYDIGRAYELSGHQTKAYDFYNKKLEKIKKDNKHKRQKQKEHKQKINVFAKKSYQEDLKINQSIQQKNILNLQKQQQDSKQLQRQNSIVEIEQDAIQDIILLEDIDEVKDYQFLHNKLALICSKMGKQNEAIENSAISMKLYDTLRQTDKSLSIKEHQQMKNKLLLQHVQILEENGLYLQVNQFIKNRIKQLELSAQQSSENSLLYHFIIAEVNIIKGLIKISRGCFAAAKAHFIISKQRTDHIKKEIKYESLQTETFYFQFLIDLIIFRSTTLRHKNEYFRHQRAKKIDQATKIFGGRIKFQNVANNSQQLIKNIEQIDQNQKKKQEESQEKLDYDLMEKIEESAVGKSIKKMQPNFKIFLNELEDKINQQDGADGYDSLFLERKMHLCFLELNDHENIGRVQSQFDQLEAKVIQKRIKNWKIQRKQQTSLKDTILKIKRMIIQMKDVYKQMKVDKGNILLDYQISIKKDIERYLSSSKKWGYTEPLMDEVKQSLKLIKINYQIGKKQSAKKQLKELFLDIRKIDNFRFQTFEGYILNINIIFQGAEMDYLNIFISKKSTQKIKSEIINKSARQLKDHKLIDCLNTIEKALKFVKKLSNQSDIISMQQQNIQVQASLRDPIRKSLNSIKKEVKQQNREMNRNRRNLRCNKVAQSKYHIQIMRVKCKIQLKMEIKQIQFSFNKIQKIKHVTQNQIHISTIRLQALGLLEYYKNQQKRSFDLLKQCFNKMKGNRLIDIKHKAILLTKIFFLLPKHTQQNDNPLKMDLQIYQSQLMSYHFYWRILLAQYISKISNRRGQGHYYIKKCKHFIENYCTEDDESKIRKSLIVSEYEASREKQKLTASAISFSRKYSMIKPPQKLHLSLEQADKISSQQEQYFQNQMDKIAREKMPSQNPSQFYQKPQSQQNIIKNLEDNISEQLRQISIKSDNLNNQQDVFQKVQFPNTSQKLPANPYQNRQDGLSKKYKSDELKREDNKNKNISGIFSKQFAGPQIQKRICELRQSRRMIMNRQLKSLMRSSSNNSSQSNYSSPQKSTNQNTSPHSKFSKSPIMIQYSLQSKRRLSPTKNFMNKKKEIIMASNSFESTNSWMSMAKLKRQNSREQTKKRYAKQNSKKLINQNPQSFQL